MDKKEYKGLCSMAANGDAKAFSRLYEMVYGAMYYTAFYSLASESDSIEAVLGAARDGFNAINRLHSEESFRVFMMKTLYARIRTFFKDYGNDIVNKDYDNEIKNQLFTLDNLDRLCAVMCEAARFTTEEISQYTGMSKRAANKRIARAADSVKLLADRNTHRIMLRKVVPEDVLPQNIINLLIDDTAELPEPDAFTFLTRLRDLGIGSADFLYLLEGCGAPEAVVERIRYNPAMSLQGLILTLENSGMTGDDYTRMLYTARQIWERTLTMRLERTQQISEGDYPEETGADESEEIAEEESFDEPTFTEVFDKINGELCESPNEIMEPESDADAIEDIMESESQQGEFTDIPDSIIYEVSETVEETPNYDGVMETSYTEEEFETVYVTDLNEDAELVSDSAESGADFVSEGYNGDTTAIIKLDPEQIREELAKLADGMESDDEEPLPEEFTENAPSPYHKRALLVGAVGAAAVIACGATAGMFFTTRGSVSYAADAREVFMDIHDSYYANIAGGENVCAFPDGNCDVFGDLLISSDGLGVFTDDRCVYNIGYETITVNLLEGGNSTAEELLPPENSRFVAAFDDEGTLIAVFSGKQSGFMRIDDGKTQYIAQQDGILTDFRAGDGEITIATVYTPTFTRSFTAKDVDVYLPRYWSDVPDTPHTIPAENVILSSVAGYSYAVNITYKTADGAVVSSAAALGNPLYAGADGRCMMNSEDGLVLNMGKSPSSVKCGKADLAAFCENGFATLENGIIHIRDNNGKVTAKVENLAEVPQLLRFSGDFLIVSGKSDVILVLDCSDIKNPFTAVLKPVSGVVSGDSALVLESADSSVTLTRYSIENGKSKAGDSVSKKISLPEGSTVRIVANTAVFTEDSCAAAFDYFDGVSVVSQLELFGNTTKSLVLYDDKTGFSFAFVRDGKFYAGSSDGIHDIFE